MKTLKLFALLGTAAFAAACSNSPVEQPPPEIQTFTATPEKVAPGGQVTFSWTTANATSVAVSFAGTELFKAEGADAAAGSKAMAVSLGGVYTLTATGNGTATKDATITMLAVAKVTEFKADPAAVKKDTETTLSWKTENATEVTVRDGATVVFTETDRAKVMAGSRKVAVSKETEFALEAKGEGGNHSLKTTVAIIPPAEITKLELADAAIREGTSTTLTWATVNAQSITLTADTGTGPTPVDTAGKNAAGDSLEVTATVATTYELTAIGEGGDAKQTVSLAILPKPVISTFTVNPTTIIRGQNATLTWTTTEATSIAIKVGTTSLNVAGKGVNDSLQITPATAGTFTYTLTASGPGGEVTADAELTVDEPIPTILTFAADKAEINDGQTVKLSWTTRDAVTVTLKDGATSIPVTGKTANDSIDLTPAVGAHSYVLTATGPGGSKESSAVTVTVNALPTVTAFAASKAEVGKTEQVTISWTTQNATAVTLKDGTTAISVTGKNPASDSVALTLTPGTHSFVLTAEGKLGATATSQTVTVQSFDAPKVLTFASDKTEVADGGSFTLSWTTEDARSITLKDGTTSIDVTGKTVNDSITLNPAVGTHSYVLTATGVGGSTSSTAVSVVVHPLPVINTFTASKANASTTEQVTLSWTTTNATALTLKDGTTSIDLTGKNVAAGSIALTLTAGSHSFVLTAEGGAASTTSSQPVVVEAHEPPAVTSFTANKADIAAGASVTLSWVTVNGATYTLKDGTTNIDITGKTGTDSITLTPAVGAHSYVLTVANPGSSVNSSAVAVTVHPQPVIATFAASKTTATSTEQVTLSWTTTGATSVTLKDGTTDVDLTGKGVATGSIALTLTAGAHSFVLTANGPGEGTVSSSAVVVQAYNVPQVLTFAANSADIADGGSVTLTWTTQDGATVTLKDGTTPIDITGKGVNDSVTLTPALGVHSYVLTVANPAASADSSAVAVTVHQLPAITSFAADKTQMVAATDTLTLTWVAQRATAVSLKDGTDVISLTGKNPLGDTYSMTVPAGTHQYVLVVEGLGGGKAESAPLTVKSYAPPQFLSFAADKAAVLAGGSVTLTWTTDTAATISLSDGTTAIELTGKNPLGDSITLQPALGNHQYQLTATNIAGLSTSAVVVVDVMNAPAFTAWDVAPLAVTLGETTTISWTATDATDVYALPYFGGGGTAVTMSKVVGDPFEDISTTGAQPTLSSSTDTGYGSFDFPAGFVFPYYGMAVTKASVTTNGYMSVNTLTSATDSNGTLPSTSTPNGVIAPFWDDLDAKTAGKIYYEVKGDAPDRRLIVQWDKYSYYSSSDTSNLTFQAVLFENGEIQFRYLTMTGTNAARATGNSATIGFEDAAGSAGYQISKDVTGGNAVKGGDSFRVLQRVGGTTGTLAATLPVGTYPLGLRAVNPVGAAVTTTKTAVSAGVPTIPTLTADRTLVGTGNAIKINWTTTNAATWRLELDGVDIAGAPQLATVTDFVINPTVGGTLTLHATNAAGREVTKNVILQVGAPVITAFTVDKTIVGGGASVNFGWTTSGAETLTLTSDSGASIVTKADPTDRPTMITGTQPYVAEAGQHVYTLTATNASGTVTATQTVLSADGVLVVSFAGTPTTITAGEQLTLNWYAVNATDISISVVGANPQPTGFPYTSTTALPTGSLTTAALATTTTYEITANGPNGPNTKQVTINVVPRPTFASFTANPPAGNSGDPITLSWEALNAAKVSVKTSTGKIVVTDQPTTGSTVVNPIEPTTYIAYATNSLGVTDPSAQLVVATTVVAPTLTASASVNRVVKGSPTTLTWSATNVEGVAVSPLLIERKNLGFVDISATGTKVVFPAMEDEKVKVTLPADLPFTFFGKSYTSFWVTTNGWLGFEATYSSSYYSNGDLPISSNPKTVVAPFWDDLKGIAADAAVFWEVQGVAPNRKVVVQWHHFSFSGATEPNVPSLNFQAILHERGDVEFQYGTMDVNGYATPTRVTGDSATIGVNNDATSTSAKFMKWSYNTAGAATAGDGLVFHIAPLPLSGSIATAPAATTTYTFTAVNSANTVTVPVKVDVVNPGDILINEVMVDPTGADGLKEWIELRNNTATAIDLRGMTIAAAGGSHTIAGADPVMLPASGYALLAQSADVAENGNLAGVTYAYKDAGQATAAFAMDNAADVIVLKIGNGVVDAVAYDAAAGWPVQEGRSLQADLNAKTNIGNDDNAMWCATAGTGVDLGTPGAANTACYTWATVAGAFVTLDGDTTATQVATGTYQYKNDQPLPFSFKYFGRTYTTYHVTSNGIVGFGTTFSDSASTRYQLPTTSTKPDVIAPYWTTMSTRTSKTTKIMSATRGSPPNREFVIEWVNYYPSGGTASTDAAPVQLILGEDGSITFQYGALVGTKSFGQNQSIGLQAFGTGFAAPFSFNSTTNVLTANSGLKLTKQ